ncbi:MAG: hypothetical protein ACPIAA_05515, partial [Flavobacteriaceae bacterium]
MKKKQFDYIICGGGAAGLLLLQALREDSFFAEKQILLIEKETKNSDDRTWCFWEAAEGKFDVMIESGLKIVDIYPLKLIVKNSGAIMTDWNGK